MSIEIELTAEDYAVLHFGLSTNPRSIGRLTRVQKMRAGDREDYICIQYLRSIRRMLPARMNKFERAHVHDHYANQWRVAHGANLNRFPRG